MKDIAQTLLDVGVQPHLSGSQYLRNAIELIATDGEATHFWVTTYIARTRGTSRAKVERAMRDAVHGALDTLNDATIKLYFGSTASKFNAPSVGGFIKAMADHCKGEM